MRLIQASSTQIGKQHHLLRFARDVVCLLCLACSFVPFAQALTYRAAAEVSQWYLSSSIFECSVVHEIPRYGKGVFYHEAGESLKFYTDTITNPMAAGKAALVIEASPWQPGRVVSDLGYVEVLNNQKRPIEVAPGSATIMMQGLLEGMAPTFTRKSWYSDERIRVQLNSVNFAQLYDAYQQCVASLLPVNFNQVSRTRVMFSVNKADLTPADRKALNDVVLYVGADPSVTTIFVDGYTDSSGTRLFNRRLSKARAEVVTEYLINKGIEPTMIRTRYHGERYPVAKNNSKANKAKNRRSTVRLSRGQENADAPGG